MKFKNVIAIVLSLVLVMGLVIGCGTSGGGSTSTGTTKPVTTTKPADKSFEEMVIKVATVSPEAQTRDGTYATASILTFRDYLAEKTDYIKPETYFAGQLGGAAEVVQYQIDGTVEINFANPSSCTTYSPSLAVITLPGAFSTMDECRSVLRSDWGDDLWELAVKESGNGVADKGIRFMNIIPFGFRNFTNTKQKITNVDSMKGLTFRTMENTMSITMVDSLGAHAVPIASSEQYMAIQQGVVDGNEGAITSLIQDLVYEVLKYVVLDGHFLGHDGYIVSEQWWSGLPAETQEVIKAGIDVASEEGDRVVDRLLAEGEVFLADFLEIYTPTDSELAEWNEACRAGTEQWMRGEVGDELVESMLAAIQDYRK